MIAWMRTAYQLEGGYEARQARRQHPPTHSLTRLPTATGLDPFRHHSHQTCLAMPVCHLFLSRGPPAIFSRAHAAASCRLEQPPLQVLLPLVPVLEVV